MSLRYIQRNGGGAVIYLAQEGRGIGLANKVAAYGLQVREFKVDRYIFFPLIVDRDLLGGLTYHTQ